jgi:LPXTG-motif cell wall-anchored protein
MRRERLTMWLAGGAFGSVAGIAVLTLGTPSLYLSLALFALGFAISRSVALVSGAFVALGVTWLALAIRASIACEEFDRLPNAGCVAPDLTPFVLTAGGIAALGALLGWVALRRRRNV